MKHLSKALFTASWVLLAATASAEELPNYKETLTGDWGGKRTALAEAGVTTDIVYKGDIMGNTSGGIKTGTRYLDNLDVVIGLDGEKLIGSKGTTAVVSFLNNNGGRPSKDLVGDAQGVNNIEVPAATTKLYQAYIQQNVMDDKLSVLAGLYGADSEFEITDSSALFIHSTYGTGTAFSQSGENGPPIFPFTAIGGRVKVQPTPESYIQVAVTDGVPGDPNNPYGTQISLSKAQGAFMIGEIGYAKDKSKLAFGAWRYTNKFDDWQEVDSDGNPVKKNSQGFYLIGEHPLYKEAEGDRGLAGFARFGVADGAVNEFSFAWSTGLVYTGLIPCRPLGQLGVGIAGAYNSSEFKDAQSAAGTPVENAETAIELTYSDAVTSWLSVQPDIQYIINPGTDPALDNALVLGMRTTVTF